METQKCTRSYVYVGLRFVTSFKEINLHGTLKLQKRKEKRFHIDASHVGTRPTWKRQQRRARSTLTHNILPSCDNFTFNSTCVTVHLWGWRWLRLPLLWLDTKWLPILAAFPPKRRTWSTWWWQTSMLWRLTVALGNFILPHLGWLTLLTSHGRGSESRRRQDVHVSVPQLVRPRARTSSLRGRDLHLGWSRCRLSHQVVSEPRRLGLHHLHGGRLVGAAIRLQRKACWEKGRRTSDRQREAFHPN